MDIEQYEKAAAEMIYLSGCVVNGKKPDKKRLDSIDIDSLFSVSLNHAMTAVVCCALQSAGINDEKFIEQKGQSIRRITLMDIEWNALSERLENEKIWYMPLKGMVIKDMYPEFFQRQMSDYDILFDSRYASKVREIMLENGFECKEYGPYYQHVYFKQPACNFEMHTALFSQISPQKVYDYYKDISSHLIGDNNNSYGYHFSTEDLYIHVIAHEHKHYTDGGTGIRSLLDIYVILRKHGNKLDMDYIAAEMKKLGLYEFEHDIRSLALSLFGGENLTNENKKMLRYMIFSGTYGNLATEIENIVKKYGGGEAGKRKYILKRLFPDMDYIKTFYPYFYRHKILLPALFFYRLGRAVTVKRKETSKQLKLLRKTDTRSGEKK